MAFLKSILLLFVTLAAVFCEADLVAVPPPNKCEVIRADSYRNYKISAGTCLVVDGGGEGCFRVKSLILSSGAGLAFSCSEMKSDCLVVGVLECQGNVSVSLFRVGTKDPVSMNGMYQILAYQGKTPDVSKWTVENPAYGRCYTFSVSNHRIFVNVESDYGG